MKLTKLQKDYIGTLLPTPRGDTLEVLRVSMDNKPKLIYYDLSCTICSKDEEMFPLGSIKAMKGKLDIGRIPCGCSPNHQWKVWQWTLRVKRECKSRGYIFHGYTDKFKGQNTKLELENSRTGHKWNTTSINNLLKGRGDPLEGLKVLSSKRSTPVKDHIKDFNEKGSYPDGTLFIKDSSPKSRRWFVICPLCSIDKFAQAGICSGVFKADTSHLKCGKRSCRCAKNPNYTKPQRELQIKEICKEEGHTFKGWVSAEETVYNSEMFKWVCKEGHPCTSSVQVFLNHGCRCKSCAKYGYDDNKRGNFYITRWYGLGKSYLKFGITNKPHLHRILQQHRKGSLSFEELYRFSHEDGLTVRLCEKLCKSETDCNKCPKHLLPDGFTETVNDTEENLSKLLYLVNSFKLEPVTLPSENKLLTGR